MADNNSNNERAPLINNVNNSGVPPPPYSINYGNLAGAGAAEPIGTDELPPPYTPTAQGGIPVINCKVCQAVLNLEGKQHLHVIKCSVCNEATPIRAPPAGKRYVRCPCNLLLVCRAGAPRILCPRETCKKVLTIGGAATFTYVCAFCQQRFVLQSMESFARCPNCRKVSALGNFMNISRRMGHRYLFLGLLLIAIATGITIGTFEAARMNGGIYVAWIGGFLLGIVFIIRAVFYYRIRVSYPAQSHTSVNR